MLRSAAKNYRSVTVVTDPADYDAVLAAHARERRRHHAETARAPRRQDVPNHERLRSRHRRVPEPRTADRPFLRPVAAARGRLRYGENPHQEASLYGNFDAVFPEAPRQGTLLQQHPRHLRRRRVDRANSRNPTVAILKHTNPCGVGTDPDLREAWDKAFATDKQAPVRRDHHREPSADRGARAGRERDFQRGHHRAGVRAGRARASAAQEKPAPHPSAAVRRRVGDGLHVRSVVGGVLVQDRDRVLFSGEGTGRPTLQES